MESSKFRTVNGVLREVKRNDPDTVISASLIRKAIKTGAIPSLKVGNRSYITIESVLAFYGGTTAARASAPVSASAVAAGIKPLPENLR